MAKPQPHPRLELDDFGVQTASGWQSARLNVHIEGGRSLLLTGRAGSGKTLILESLAGVLRPSTQQVGRAQVPTFSWVPQDARLSALPTDRVWSLLGLSGLRVRIGQTTGVRLNPSVDEKRAIELMDRLGLDADRIAELPFRDLSATERRSTLFVRAVLAPSDFIGIDGWDEQMDGTARRAIAARLREEMAVGRGIVLSSRRFPPRDWEDAHVIDLEGASGDVTGAVPLIRKTPPAPAHEHPVLELNRVSVLRGRLNVLARKPPACIVDGASLFVRHGECMVLLGAAGSGKTTILHAISGLQRTSRGIISVEGNDVTQARGRRARRLRRDVQLVFQDAASVLDGYRTVQAHLEQAMGINRRATGSSSAWMERVGLSPRLLRSPADQLSAAESQRIDLVRSLVVEPKILLFDAPEVSGAATDGGVVAALVRAEQAKGRAFLIATSNPEIARAFANRVAFIHAGRVLELGTKAEVLDRPAHPLTRAFVGQQPVPRNDPTAPAVGCPYVGECSRRELPQCDEKEPMLAPFHALRDLTEEPGAGQRRVACYHPISDQDFPSTDD